MRAIKLVFTVLLLASALSAVQTDMKTWVDSLLSVNADYQQALARYERSKADLALVSSLNWFDVNLSYRTYDNDYTREESNDDYEFSTVNEKDTRWRLELEKQFFPNDFDNVTDITDARMDLLRYRQELKLAYLSAADDILTDMADWYEAEKSILVLQEKLDILYYQKQVLEDLEKENLVSPEPLILNLEEIDKREDDLNDFRIIAAGFRARYGNALPQYELAVVSYTAVRPDTLALISRIEQETRILSREISKLSGRIRRNYLHFYLPQTTLTLSYNKRETRQNWDIERNSQFKTMLRDQNEEFPEAEIEVSLPFNLYSNLSGKLGLLKAYERELRFRGNDLLTAWDTVAAERMVSYYAARQELARKERLHSLYTLQQRQNQEKFREESALLGGNPEQKLQKDANKVSEAKIAEEKARMKLCKEIFLINNLGEVNK